MKRKLILFLLLLAVTLCGCTPRRKTVSVQEKVPEGNSGPARLVWVTDNATLQKDKKIYEEFNTLLAKKGYDFTVDFKGVIAQGYDLSVQKMKASGEPADILFSGFSSDAGSDSYTYLNFVKDGYYEPLDPYFSTASGKKLFAAYDGKLWEGSKVNGKIYGLQSASNFSWSYYWLFNKELLEKYHIKESSLSGNLADMGDIFNKVYKGEKSDSMFDTIDTTGDSFFVTKPYDVLTSCVGVDQSGSDARAVNIFGQNPTLALLKVIKQYRDAGYTRDFGYGVDNFFVMLSSCVPGNEKDLQSYSMNEHTTVKTVAVPMQGNFEGASQFQDALTGIASWSAQKDLAFSLLTFVNTDKDAGNLLKYGIEGRTYQVVDGYAETLDNKYCPNYETMMLYGNSLITYPCKTIRIKKGIDYPAAFKMVKPSTILGFHFDESAVQEQVKKTDAVLSTYDALFIGDVSDVTAEFSKLNSELDAAGVGQIVSEANRQIEAWKGR